RVIVFHSSSLISSSVRLGLLPWWCSFDPVLGFSVHWRFETLLFNRFLSRCVTTGNDCGFSINANATNRCNKSTGAFPSLASVQVTYPPALTRVDMDFPFLFLI